MAHGVLHTAWVVLDATQHPLGDQLGDAVVWFVVPLTAITILTLLSRELVARRRSPPRAGAG